MKGLKQIYNALHSRFGPQRWWPAETYFEVMVGAILTQNTNWSNVEKAIANLKDSGLLSPHKLFKASHKKLSLLIRPAGYYNLKAKRLKSFLKYFIHKYQGNVMKMSAVELGRLRQELLLVNGIGPETADSILLYALNKPIFVVDAYTKRIMLRHGLIGADSDYNSVQDFFMSRLNCDAKLFNEYHALIVRAAKEFCLKNNPRCKFCPLSKFKKRLNNGK